MLKMPHKDRGAHFVYGACVANVVIALTGIWMNYSGKLSPALAAAIGLGAAVLVGLVKEAHDRYANLQELKLGKAPSHGVSSADLAWTVFGGMCATVPTFLLCL